MSLDAAQIAEYLRQNPDFFEANITLLTDVEIPHPHGGRAISISERQVLALREKNRLIEGKLAELIQFGEENDAISGKIHRFACQLIGARQLDDVLAMTCTDLRESFAVPHALVRLWHPALAPNGRPETVETTTEIRDFVAAMKTPYCGAHGVYETDRWFGEAAPHLKSFAMAPLAGQSTFGVLLLASEDAQRFYPEMGTLYLTRIGELVSAAIQAHIVS
ncbi:MAG: DUF484 family protein [Burkholderiales bacterium]|nr:DUF484 family protein [Burkholderiales bacterium]